MKRFKANGNGCPAWKKQVDEVRYFFHKTQYAVMRSTGSACELLDTNGIEPFKFTTPSITPNNFCDDGIYIEVTAADLPYLEKPEGDWEFRKVGESDSYMQIDLFGGGGHRFISDGGYYTIYESLLSGFRWCRPRKKLCPNCANTQGIRLWEE